MHRPIRRFDGRRTAFIKRRTVFLRRRAVFIRRLDRGKRRSAGAHLIDCDVADLGRIVACHTLADRRTVVIDIDVGVDHIGLVEHAEILGFVRRRLNGGFDQRLDGARAIGRRALDPVNLALIVVLAG